LGNPFFLLWHCCENLLENLYFRVLDGFWFHSSTNSLKHTSIHKHRLNLLPPILRNPRPAIVRTSCDRKKRTRRREKRGGRRVILEAAKKGPASRNSTLAGFIRRYPKRLRLSVCLSPGLGAVVCFFVFCLVCLFLLSHQHISKLSFIR